ncbi:hypothetical protein RHECNPAF_12210058 [Rhizobium etli CNPAF512]|nr:hypothetical protein RHECNPAF_12210058 [Rhizobium etli CNPAF512]
MWISMQGDRALQHRDLLCEETVDRDGHFIEIRNTHDCPQEKLEKLWRMDVDVLEIDVSGYRVMHSVTWMKSPLIAHLAW